MSERRFPDTDQEFRHQAWSWREVQIHPVKSQRSISSVYYLLIPFVIAGLLCFWNKMLLGAIAAGIGLFQALLKFLVPHIYELLQSLLTGCGRWLGKVISYISLTIVYVVVLTPVALFARLLRRDSLNLKWFSSERTYWLEVPRDDTTRLFDKPFLLERQQHERGAGYQKVLRIGRMVYQTALTLFCLNLVLGVLAIETRSFIKRNNDISEMKRMSVYENLEWTEAYYKEFDCAFPAPPNIKFMPFTGWIIKDHQGCCINIKDGIRKTYQASSNTPSALRVYTFGGSTMWGVGGRDDYTIPSCLVKRAEQDNIHLEVTNLSVPGYVNWQGVIRLAELCAVGKVPDLVIFYEGINDMYGKLQTPDMNRVYENYDGWRTELEERWPKRWFLKHSFFNQVGRVLKLKLQGPEAYETAFSTEPKAVYQLANEVVNAYRENAVFVRKIAEVYDFESIFFWQPVIYTKRELSSEEEEFSKPLVYADMFIKTYRAATEEIRSQDFAIDLTDIFDDNRHTIYIDWAHVSEEGNQIIADGMYNHLRPLLQH
ncbi:MAG: SGNH/GDSL hydrolase family protein [Candidatus Poribacteria bacterium]|nr:SGNH/GDSL hydrolase family protein [Candidatus Poribacteria bacterium]